MRPYSGGQISTHVEEQKKPGRNIDPRTMKRIALTCYPYRSELVTILAGTILATLLGLVPCILISFVIDDAIQKGHATLLVIYVACMAGALILSGLIGVGQTYLSNKLGQNIMYDLQNRLYEHLERLPLNFFTGTRTSEIQSSLVNDLGGIQGAVTNTATNVSGLAVIVSSTIVMLVISPLLTLIMLGLLPLFVWIIYKVGQMRRQTSRERQKRQASLSAQMQETLSVGRMLLVKVFGQQRYAQAQSQQENKAQEDLTLRKLMIERWFKAAIGILFALIPIFVYLVAGEQIVQHVSLLRGTMTIGTMVAFTMLQLSFFSPLEEFMSAQVQFEKGLAPFGRIFAYLDLLTTISDKPGAVHLTPDQVQGSVNFRNVTFGYKNEEDEALVGLHEERRLNDDEAESAAAGQALVPSNLEGDAPGRDWPLPIRNITFSIQPGQLVALVGPDGVGKKTIGYLLPRFYDVESGEIEIDGINVKDIAQASLSELISVVTQETCLFHGSIRENLLYTRPDATEEEMIVAAQAAAIHEHIMELDAGYETVVGGHGDKLSEGEKQRMEIACAMLKNPRILILDEATGSLDAESESLVQASLETLMRGRTTLAIAHRPSTLLAADVILVVNKGEIVERGTHQELLASGGLYAQLYHEQFARTPVGAITSDRKSWDAADGGAGDRKGHDGVNPSSTPRLADAPSEGIFRQIPRITRQIPDLSEQSSGTIPQISAEVGSGDRKSWDGVNPSSTPRLADAPSEGIFRQIPRITRQIPDLSEQSSGTIPQISAEVGTGDRKGRDEVNPSSTPRLADGSSGSFTPGFTGAPAGSFTKRYADASSWLSTLWHAEEPSGLSTAEHGDDLAGLKYRGGDEGRGSAGEGIPAVETQMSDQLPSEATIQRKTGRPTVKLPARVASENDRLSTAFLPPGIREIFAPSARSQQGAPMVENTQGGPDADNNSMGSIEADI